MLLLLAALLLPQPAAAYVDLWTCDATHSLRCRQGEGCAAAEPRISAMEIMPVTGRIGFCVGALCYEGVMELEKEGWPDYRTLGTARVEELPLARVYRPGPSYFVSFDEAAGSFALASLHPGSQDTTWFACRRWGD